MEGFMVYLPDLMKELRMDRGLSQAKVARGLNISPQSYNRYENGERKPSFDLIFSLAKYYEISVIHFLAVAPTKKFIPDFELYKLEKWMQTRDELYEYSLFDVAYQFEEMYIKTYKAYQKFRNLQKNTSKSFKRLNEKYVESDEIKKMRTQYASLRSKLSYYESTLKLLLKEKMERLINK